MSKIFIVEDEKTIRDELNIFLSRYGYEIEAPDSFENIIENLKESSSDLILLDINLPIFDGYYICREVRKFSEVPIIVVTSRDSDIDELMSMNLGADDFITKPYNTQILLARIESILKRVNRNLKTSDVLEYNDMKVNLSNGTINYNNETIEITKNELKILSYLIKNKGKIVSREKLMNYLWDCEMFIDDNTLSVNVTRIRKKLEEIGLKNIIETRRGLGYIIS
ncbi:response regulator transcription factor [uncultured Clostridium sp.]|uniref:response regulator transcription factor n=1 Tax=uncultured Clostridium sp. TaxID=59620 RepID=UPI0026202A97|nr:response regulator transcription factor [uncultured Clostridium sp.]